MNENSENLKEQKTLSLELVLNQIASFDNKASIIVSILGIVFALSFTVIEVVSSKSDQIKPYLFTSFLLFLISTIAALTFSVLVLSPKNRKGNLNHKSLTYYKDLKDITHDEYMKLFKENGDCGISIEQINQNARICSFKHLMLKISIVLMIPIVLFFIITTILIIWF
jgi:hypothetical protein